MKRRPSSQKVIDILEAQQDRFEHIVKTLDNAGALAALDKLFEETNSRLRSASLRERRRVIETLAENAAQRLSRYGVEPGVVRSVEEIIVKNWLGALASGERRQLSVALREAVVDWEKELEKERQRSEAVSEAHRARWVGAMRVAAGGGAVVFDSANMIVVTPMPNYLFASIMGGAVLMLNGVDDLWKGHH